MILVDRTAGLERARDVAVKAMRDGGVVVLPTDTVYGLACDPGHPRAADRIYELKARPRERRLPVILEGAPPPEGLGLVWTEPATRLARAFWPGALTIAVAVGDGRPDWLADRDEVAVRAPASDLAAAIAAEIGPYLMTSANRHGSGTPRSLESALDSLHGEPAAAIDGGLLSEVSSTLVNVNVPEPVVEREGAIPSSAVIEALAG
jgi:L-threonylcarbamoyladenylate synthase